MEETAPVRKHAANRMKTVQEPVGFFTQPFEHTGFGFDGGIQFPDHIVSTPVP